MEESVPRILGVRELTKGDVERLKEPRRVQPLKQLRYSHHQLAIYDASGMSLAEMCMATGYSPARISILRKDPAYQMLVAEKRAKLEEKQIEVIVDAMHQKLQIMISADRHIRDTISDLDDIGELLPIKQALAISADMADRVGYGKHTTQTHHDGDFAARMEASLQRTSKVIEARPKALPIVGTPKVEPIDAEWLADPKVVEFQPQAVSVGASLKRGGSESPSLARPPTLVVRRRF